jgi:hypothetical protein
MTTIVNFKPTGSTPFSFNATLDSNPYVITIPWNAYGLRYYINIYDTSNNLVMVKPLIASPDTYNINLLFGYFTTSTLVFRDSSQNFEITP